MDAAGSSNLSGQAYRAFSPGREVMAAVMPRRSEGGAQAQHIVVPAASAVSDSRGRFLGAGFYPVR